MKFGMFIAALEALPGVKVSYGLPISKKDLTTLGTVYTVYIDHESTEAGHNLHIEPLLAKTDGNDLDQEIYMLYGYYEDSAGNMTPIIPTRHLETVETILQATIELYKTYASEEAQG